MTKKLITVLLLFGLTACGNFWDDSEAKRVAEDSGFTDVVTTGRRVFGCGRDDGYVVGFEGTNAQGKRVTGVVCGGIFFKSYTVRID